MSIKHVTCFEDEIQNNHVPVNSANKQYTKVVQQTRQPGYTKVCKDNPITFSVEKVHSE